MLTTPIRLQHVSSNRGQYEIIHFRCQSHPWFLFPKLEIRAWLLILPALACAAGFALYDMIGNAAEWTETAESSGRRVARGGSFADTWNHATCSYRWLLEPQGDNRVGFRCVIAPRP